MAVTEQAVRAGRPAADPRSGFAGRERELRQLRADIARAGLSTLSGRPSPHSRVLLIAGRPGSGRTALAGELARQLAADYPDGVFRAGLTDPGGAPVPVERTARELLTALEGAAAVPAGADEDDLTAALRDAFAERRALLLLDDVARPGQLLDLLPDSRGTLVVAVAPGPLTGVPDVRPCALGGLDRAAAVELLGRRAGVATRITVDPRGAESLAEACGDLPAALALVGGWLAARPKMSVADATLRLAEVAVPGDEQKNGALARAFHLVHGTLPRTDARTLRLLALAPAGSLDAHTASALAGSALPEAQALLERLAALGLLHDAPAGGYTVPRCLDPLLRALLSANERPAEVMLARARMLERTVRQLQACRAVTEPDGSPARAHLAAMPRALRFPHSGAAREWLLARRPVLLSGARMAVAEGGGELDTLARRLISALGRAFEAHLSADEAAAEVYRLHELALEVAERGERQRERATALLGLGGLDAGAGRLPQARSRYRTALDASRAAGNALLTGRALEALAGTYADGGDWERAADWYGRALALRQTSGDLAAVARLHGCAGDAHRHARRWEEALREWRAAAAAHRRLRDPGGQARALGEAARVQVSAGRPREALRTREEALGAARRAADPELEAALLAESGTAHRG